LGKTGGDSNPGGTGSAGNNGLIIFEY
jgi:hypothetical protein